MKHMIFLIYLFLFKNILCLNGEVFSEELIIKDKIEVGYKVNVQGVLINKGNVTFLDEFGILQFDEKFSLVYEVDYSIEVLEIDENSFAIASKIVINKATKNVNANKCNYQIELNLPYIAKKSDKSIVVTCNGKEINDKLFNRLFLFPMTYEKNLTEFINDKEEEVLTRPANGFTIEKLDFITGSTKLEFLKTDKKITGVEKLFESNRTTKYKYKMSEKNCSIYALKSADCDYVLTNYKLLATDSYIRAIKDETKKVEKIIGHDSIFNAYGEKVINTFDSDFFTFNK